MSTPPPPSMTFIEPSFGHAVRVWWAWLWRAVLLAAALGFVIGFFLGFAGAAIGRRGLVSTAPAQLALIVVGILAAIYVMKFILSREFRTFRIVLLPVSLGELGEGSAPDELSPTYVHALVVWWAWLWRWVMWFLVLLIASGVVFDLIGGMLLGIPSTVRFNLGLFVVGPVGTFLISVYVLKGLLGKDFKKFRVRLATKPSAES